jgi:DnaK suppressor protein
LAARNHVSYNNTAGAETEEAIAMPAKKPTTGKKTVAKSTPSKAVKPAAKPVSKAPVKAAAKPAATATPKKAPAKVAAVKTAAAKPAKAAKPVAKAEIKKPVAKTAVKTAAKEPTPVKAKAAPAVKTAPAAKTPAKAPATTSKESKPAASAASSKTAPTKTAVKTPVAPAKTSSKKSVEKSVVNTQKQTANSKSSGTTLATFAPYQAAKDEDYMNDEQKNHFREILLQWKANLMEEVDRTVTHMKDEAANFPDPADRATQEEEFSFELRTRDRERKLIKKIDQTIERIALLRLCVSTAKPWRKFARNRNTVDSDFALTRRGALLPVLRLERETYSSCLATSAASPPRPPAHCIWAR